MTRMLILAGLSAIIGSRAEIAHQIGPVKRPMSSCSCNQKYNPSSPLYNLLASPYLTKYPHAPKYSEFSSDLPVPPLNNVEISDSSPPCPCGCGQALSDSAPVAAPPVVQFLGTPPPIPGVPTFSGYGFHPDYATHTGPQITIQAPTPVSVPPTPPAPGLPTVAEEEVPTSHIMKIPKKSDSSSITITFNTPDSTSESLSSVSTTNSLFSSLSPPSTPLTMPSRPTFYTQPGPFLASCPATVFYPATITSFPGLPPPFTCPAHPSVLISTTPTIPTPSAATLPTPVANTTTKPMNEGKTIGSFTTTLQDPKLLNVTTPTGKRDPLLTFKLLTAAAAKSKEPAPPASSSFETEVPSSDCSMPIPPVGV